MIPTKVKRLIDDGFKPMKFVIPNPVDAPKGSGVYQFRRGRDSASLVITPRGKVLRGVIVYANGKFQNL